MNHMLWQLEIHAKSIVEHINEDTQCKICGCTQSLKLKACFHVQIKSMFWKLFFYQVHAKKYEFIWYLGRPFIIFILNVSKNIFLRVLDQSQVSFKNTSCWFFPKHVMSKIFFLFKSQKELYIIYNYTNIKKNISKHA